MHTQEDKYAEELIHIIHKHKDKKANDNYISKLDDILKTISPEIVLFNTLLQSMPIENLVSNI